MMAATTCRERHNILLSHKGVKELRGMRCSRRTMLEKFFYKPVRLKCPAVTLSGAKAPSGVRCKCCFVTGLHDCANDVKMRRRMFGCGGCESADPHKPFAKRFAERISAIDQLRAQQLAQTPGCGDSGHAPTARPYNCLLQEIPQMDCPIKPDFGYRSLMRRLRETHDRLLGRYREKPIVPDRDELCGQECSRVLGVGTQTTTDADGELWTGGGRVMTGHQTKCICKKDKDKKKPKSATGTGADKSKSGWFSGGKQKKKRESEEILCFERPTKGGKASDDKDVCKESKSKKRSNDRPCHDKLQPRKCLGCIKKYHENDEDDDECRDAANRNRFNIVVSFYKHFKHVRLNKSCIKPPAVPKILKCDCSGSRKT